MSFCDIRCDDRGPVGSIICGAQKRVSSKRHDLDGVSRPRRNSLKPEQLPIETTRGSRPISRRAHEHHKRGNASPREPVHRHLLWIYRRKNDRDSTDAMLTRETWGRKRGRI
jgi:hypothetical protein